MMFEKPASSKADSVPAQACASPMDASATTEVATEIQCEISAIAEAEVAATETDGNPWAVAEDEERHHEADDLVAKLKIQLKAELEQPGLAVECLPEPPEITSLKNLSPTGTSTVSTPPHAVHIHVFSSCAEALVSIQMLKKNGFDTKKLSLVGTGMRSDEDTFGFYAGPNGIKTLGSPDAFWGSVWALLSAPAILFIPGLGLLAMAGPVVSALVGDVEGAIVVGGLFALGMALTQIGIPEAHAVEYEAALKINKYLLITHGTAEDAARVNAVLRD